ncbi:MAG: SMC-Scp complex subunit ScpB [Thermoguttaceae bacterium]
MSGTPEHEPSPPEGISLDELAQAFAQVMGTAPKLRPAEAAPAPSDTPSPGEPPAAASAEEAPEDSCPLGPRSILEAMLFVGNQNNQSLSAAAAAQWMRDVEPAEIPGLVDELNARYALAGCPYQIVHEGGGYRLLLRNEYHGLANRFLGRLRQARLSQAAIDVLAIVAYQQPLTAEEVHQQRGKPSGHVLAQLVHRGLLRIEREPAQRHVSRYFTTDRFLRLFGLETLQDLPQCEELGQ